MNNKARLSGMILIILTQLIGSGLLINSLRTNGLNSVVYSFIVLMIVALIFPSIFYSRSTYLALKAQK